MEYKSIRTAYGEGLVDLGGKRDDIVVLEADLGKSTMSCMFQEKFPERYFEMGIAEQNMLSTAAGLALGGKIPFASTFAVFASGRAYDQIRQTISIGNLKVRICGSSSGLSDFGDGSTHQSIEDAAIMSSIPNMTVLVPLDAVEMKKMMIASVDHEGPIYFRVNRNDSPVYTDENSDYQIGKIYTIKEGKDCVVFANGIMVTKALEAAKRLEKEGIDLEVVNVSTFKPLDKEGVLEASKRCKAVVTAEEHSVLNGLGAAVASCLRMENIPVEFVGVEDKFGTSALNYEEILDYYGLTSDAICEGVKKVLKVKKINRRSYGG